VSGLLATIGCHRVADLVNRALRYDPATRAMLARLDRKTLRLECDLSPLPLPAPVLTLAFHTDGVELEPGANRRTDPTDPRVGLEFCGDAQ